MGDRRTAALGLHRLRVGTYSKGATTSWGYNASNEITSRISSTTGWASDANGNQTAATWVLAVAQGVDVGVIADADMVTFGDRFVGCGGRDRGRWSPS